MVHAHYFRRQYIGVFLAVILLGFVMTSLSLASVYSSYYSVKEQGDCLNVQYVLRGGFGGVSGASSLGKAISLPVQPYSMHDVLFKDTYPLSKYKSYSFDTDNCVINYYEKIKINGVWRYYKTASKCVVHAHVKRGYKDKNSGLWQYLLYGTIYFNSTIPYELRNTQASITNVHYYGQDAIASFSLCKHEQDIQFFNDNQIKQLSFFDTVMIYIHKLLGLLHEVL